MKDNLVRGKGTIYIIYYYTHVTTILYLGEPQSTVFVRQMIIVLAYYIFINSLLKFLSQYDTL